MHLGFFGYAELKNGGNQRVAFRFHAKKKKFKMAAIKIGFACNVVINAPISVILVSIPIFTRPRVTIKCILKKNHIFNFLPNFKNLIKMAVCK